MKIRNCVKGHLYDAGYFKECPHCKKKTFQKQGKKESSKTTVLSSQNTSVITDSTTDSIHRDQNTNLRPASSTPAMGFRKNLEGQIKSHASQNAPDKQAKTISAKEVKTQKQPRSEDKTSNTKQKVSDSKNNLDRVTKGQTPSPKHPISKNQAESKSVSKKTRKLLQGDLTNMVLMASMPSKITKNQEVCVDVCLFESSSWRDGADMLTFKCSDAVRDIKTISLPEEAEASITFSYKDEILLKKTISVKDERNTILTYPIIITDTRDRRLHMIKITFALPEYDFEEVLLLQPSL